MLNITFTKKKKLMQNENFKIYFNLLKTKPTNYKYNLIQFLKSKHLYKNNSPYGFF